MSNRNRCHCPRCTIRSLMGPAVLVTLGMLFLFHEVGSGYVNIWHTYPVILVVMGMVLLASDLAPMDDHIYSTSSGSGPSVPPSTVNPGPPMPGSTPPSTSGSTLESAEPSTQNLLPGPGQ